MVSSCNTLNGYNYRDPNISPKAAELSLVAASAWIHGNTAPNLMDSLAKYQWTYQVTQDALEELEAKQIIQSSPPGIGMQPLAVYFVLLSLFSQLFSSKMPFRHECLLTLLCSPTVVHTLISTPPFQSLMRALENQEFHLAKKLLAKIVEEYAYGRYFPADAGLPSGRQMVGSFLANTKEELQARKNALSHMKQSIERLIHAPPGTHWEEYGLQMLGCIEEFQTNILKIASFSPSSLLFNAVSPAGKEVIQAPRFHERILSGWGLGHAIHPSLSPLLFLSATPDLAESTLRVGGVALAVLTDQPLLSTFLIESALKLIPASIEESTPNRRVRQFSEQVRAAFMREVNQATRDFEEVLTERGWPRAKIEKAKKILLQTLSTFTYSVLANQSSPFLVALYTDYFCAYMGALAANHGVAKPELFVSEKGLKNLPLKLFAGVTFMLAHWAGLGIQTATLFSALATTPVLMDAITSHLQYEQRLQSFFSSRISPTFYRVKNFGLLAKESFHLASRVSGSRTNLLFRTARHLTSCAVVAGMTNLLKRNREGLRSSWNFMKRAGRWALNTAGKIHTATLSSQFIPNILGSLVPLIGRPMNHRTAVMGSLSLLATAASGNPALGVVVTEMADATLPSDEQILEFLDTHYPFNQG